MHGCAGAVITGDPEVAIEHLEYDSRLVRPGTLFFAVTGFTRDGYDFVADVLSRGAVAVMGERESHPAVPVHVRVPDIRQAMADAAAKFYGFPGKQLFAIAVTGTNGKTTTCYLLRCMLEAAGRKAGLVSSTLYDVGGEQFPAERTTPEALDLQRLLFLMRKNGCAAAVMEVSSHALALKRVEHILFRVGVFTNITRDHLDFHKSMAEYLAAKKRLLGKLAGPHACAVLNLDVPEFRAFFGDARSEHMSYSLQDTHADVYASRYEIEPMRTVFDLATPAGMRTVTFPLPGRFNLMNAVAAAAGGLAAGIDLDTVVAGLESATPVPGRFNAVDAGQPFGVYVDFAHTPDALERLCQSAREMTAGRVLLVFGCGGDRDRGKRPLMGTAATTMADYAVVTSDNPRTESPLAIIEDIRPGLRGDRYAIEPDRRKAIALALRAAASGDVVLLAGKGAERYQEVNGERRPFDDVEEARAALAAMGYKKASAGANSTARK